MRQGNVNKNATPPVHQHRYTKRNEMTVHCVLSKSRVVDTWLGGSAVRLENGSSSVQRLAFRLGRVLI